jgi:hypothetical protein
VLASPEGGGSGKKARLHGGNCEGASEARPSSPSSLVARLRSSASAEAAQGALALLANLASSGAGKAAVLAADGAIGAAMAALRAHAGDVGVQTQGLALLASLAYSSDAGKAGDGPTELIAAGAAQVFFEPFAASLTGAAGRVVRDATRRTLTEAVAEHAPLLRASLRHCAAPACALPFALALLYCGEGEEDAAADFGAGSAGLRQLQLALADDDADVRLSGARAVAHLLAVRLAVDFEALPVYMERRAELAALLLEHALPPLLL